MTCELQFQLQNKNENVKIADLEERCKENANYDLIEELKGGKMKISWPHTPSPVTGQVRAKLIHQRIHQHKEDNSLFKQPRSNSLNQISWVWTLLVTIPAVSFGLYSFLKWLGFDHQPSVLYGVLGGVTSLLIEIFLFMIQEFKLSEKGKFKKNVSNNHKGNTLKPENAINLTQSFEKLKRD